MIIKHIAKDSSMLKARENFLLLYTWEVEVGIVSFGATRKLDPSHD
jgi:hypothetical protein